MTDKELLEAAAKAAGLAHLWCAKIDSISPEWNPLTDDGDALRLASKLRLDVYFHESGAMVNTEDGRLFDEFHSDPCVATRRAIVRAAAAMNLPARAL